jgi:hypothetical protein
MSSPILKRIEISAPSSREVDSMRSMPESVASASSTGRVMRRSTSSGVELRYGMLTFRPGNSMSGRNSSGSCRAPMMPISVMHAKNMLTVTGRRREISVSFMPGRSCAPREKGSDHFRRTAWRGAAERRK